MRFLDWFKQPPPWQNRAARYTDPGIVACYWDGTGQMAHAVKDVSLTGAYLYTAEPWIVGTMLAMTLQEAGDCESASPGSISISCRVVRHGPDGVAVSFMLDSHKDRKALERFLRATVHLRQARSALGLEMRAQGQALVEFALMVPLIFVLIINALNFGGFIYAWITVANAVRAGSQYFLQDYNSVGMPVQATGAQVASLVQSDLSTLPGGASATVSVCTNNNGVVATFSGTCSSTTTPADPEAPTAVLLSVDVNYTYTPFVSAFSFPLFGIVLPGNTIHRFAVMRLD